MIDLKLQPSTELCFVDSQPSYEQIVAVCGELEEQLSILKYDQFVSEALSMCDVYINAFVASEYVYVHGYDDHIASLIGYENLLTNVKELIIKFAKWLFNLISNFVKWFVSLFFKSKQLVADKDTLSNAEKSTTLLISTNKAEKEKVKRHVMTVCKELKEGSIQLPSPGTQRQHYLPEDKQEIIELFKLIANNASFMTHNIDETNLSDIDQDVRDLIELLDNSPNTTTTVDAVGEYILSVSDYTDLIRRDFNILLDRLRQIRPLNQNASEHESQSYIDAVCKSFSIKLDVFRSDDGTLVYSEVSKTLKAKIDGMHRVFRRCLSLDRHAIDHLKPMVTRLYGQYYKTQDPTQMTKEFSVLAGAIDVKVKIPEDLMQRIRDAWKCNLISINRIVITSTRATANQEQQTGLSIYKLIKNKFVPSKDIYITYMSFKNSIWHKEDRDRYEQSLKNMNVDPKQYYVHLEPDRVKAFLLTIVHETRHIYQYLKNIHTKDLGKISSSHKEYLEFEHEMDARKAAMNFVFKDSDVDWAERILNECIAQEYKELRKRWKID